MGWGRMMLLGNLGQQLDIGDLETAITEMQHSVLDNQRIDLDQARNITALQRENRDFKIVSGHLDPFAGGQGRHQTGRNRNGRAVG